MDIATLCGAALGVILDTALVTSSDIPMISFNPYVEGIAKVASVAACACMGVGLGELVERIFFIPHIKREGGKSNKSKGIKIVLW